MNRIAKWAANWLAAILLRAATALLKYGEEWDDSDQAGA